MNEIFIQRFKHSWGKGGRGQEKDFRNKWSPNRQVSVLVTVQVLACEDGLNSMFFVKLACLAKSSDKYKTLRSVSPYSESWSWEGQLFVVGETLEATNLLLTTAGKDMGQIIFSLQMCESRTFLSLKTQHTSNPLLIAWYQRLGGGGEGRMDVQVE